MAQDFGDDMGNALLNFVTRQTENYLRFGRGRERAFDWWQRHYKKEGNTPEAAKAMAEKQSSREQVVVPFGTSEEAAYYAQVCRENGTYAAVYTDKQGNGFLAFAKEDAETVAGYAPQFKDVMARLDEQRITDALNHAEPVNKKTMDSLTELTSYPDLPAEDVTVIPVTIRYKDAPEETYDVLFSEQDTENLNIDDSICFSGYSHKELTEMVGRETHEDFDVISVGAPYKVHATQVKTDAPEKTYDVPGKDAPARSEKGAKSALIEKWKQFAFYKENEDTGEKELAGRYPKLVGYWNVFNAEDIEGIPPENAPVHQNDRTAIIAQNLEESSRCPIIESSGYLGSAAYSPATDRILIAPRETFRSDEAFTRVLLHEMTHSTGHPSALARVLDTRFGSPSYAEEELVAELGSLFLSADLGIQNTELEGEFYENHVSYLQSWMNALENDPSYLFKAASKADHADTFIMERYEEELGKNIEIDAPELEEEVSLAGESHDMASASEHQPESEMPENVLSTVL